MRSLRLLASKFQTIARYPSLLVASSIGGSGFGLYYLHAKYPGFYERLFGKFVPVSASATLVGGGIAALIAFGPKATVRLSGARRFLQDPWIAQVAVQKMRDPSKVLSGLTVDTLVPSRQKSADYMIDEIEQRMGTKRCLNVTGMKETGKTTLMRHVAVQLAEGGTPCCYIPATEDSAGLNSQILSALGVRDDFASIKGVLEAVEWWDIASLFERICVMTAGPSVIIFDGISSSMCDADINKIQRLQRTLSEEYPQCVVVLVTSDSTDLFKLKQEGRRDIITLYPFKDEAVEEYLKMLGVDDESDSAKLTAAIHGKFEYSLIEIEKMVGKCVDEEGKVNFERVRKYMEEREAMIKQQIGYMCKDGEQKKKLKEFVESKGVKAFDMEEWKEAFGEISNKEELGFKLLAANDMLYIAEQGILVFQNANVRNATAKF